MTVPLIGNNDLIFAITTVDIQKNDDFWLDVYGLNGKNKQTGCDFYGRTDNVNGLESILKKVSHTELTADDLVDISRATSISEAIDYVALSIL